MQMKELHYKMEKVQALSKKQLEAVTRIHIINEYGHLMEIGVNLEIYGTDLQDDGKILRLFVKDREN